MKILIVDDEPNILASLKPALERMGYDVVISQTFNQAEILLNDSIDVAMLDVWLGDRDGIELLGLIKKRYPRIECIMISGHAQIETAVAAVKSGAYDFLEKPLSLDRIDVLLSNISRLKKLERERDELRMQLGGDEQLIGESLALRELKNTIKRIAPEESRILITGENGTGKELVARSIHRNSARNKGPFLAINCAALPDELIESELFGFEKGAFTGAVKSKPGKFELALGGTLFLDEIGETAQKTQAKLLRAVEEGKITHLGGTAEIKTDVRVISATNKDLKKMVAEGKFREDLYYRLAVLVVEIPSLRERRDDIPLLIQYFADRFCRQRGRAARRIDKSAMEIFRHYAYPGNIRELANYIERVLILTTSETITSSDIETILPHLNSIDPKGTLKDVSEKFERDYIRKVIDHSNGNMTEAADALGLERSHLYKKMKSLGMEINGRENSEK